MTWMTRFMVELPALHRNRLSDCYAWHKAIWQCFPNRPDASRDFLFRLDEVPAGTLVHVLSPHEPQRPDFCTEDHWQIKAVPPCFMKYNCYRFDVICNPGRKVEAFTSDGQRKKNSRREAIIKPDEQNAWLDRKAAANGFEVLPGMRIDPSTRYSFRKDHRSGTHIGVRFSGVLRVTQRDEFCRAFHKGLGSARGFGFGMLLLSPVR